MRRGRLRWKNLLTAVVAVVVLIGAISAIASIAGRKSTAIRKSSFSIGALDEDGAFREYNQAIVSDYFECQGLTVEPTDKASGTYRVFYYTEDKKLLSKTDEMNPMDGVYEKGDDFAIAKYARVMITPDIPADEEGSDFRILFWEVVGYASGYTVTVDKQQKFLYTADKNILRDALFLENKSYHPPLTAGDIQNWWEIKQNKVYDASDVTSMQAMKIPENTKKMVFVCSSKGVTTLKFTIVTFFASDGSVVAHEPIAINTGSFIKVVQRDFTGDAMKNAEYFVVEGVTGLDWQAFAIK